MDMRTISPRELQQHWQAGPVEAIDVRTPVEFRELHAPQTLNVPLDQLRPTDLMQGRQGSSDAPLYIFCRSGNRARKAWQKFHEAGYDQVVVVDGGMLAWEEAGLPVERGKKAMSLERQVRIVAGFLVFVGAVLSLTVDYRFALLPAFVGAGLMFAGITDTCGMGMLLARMPWNRVAPCGPDQQEAGCKVSS
jgi:rhodanese-related sulfurtransferase